MPCVDRADRHGRSRRDGPGGNRDEYPLPSAPTLVLVWHLAIHLQDLVVEDEAFVDAGEQIPDQLRAAVTGENPEDEVGGVPPAPVPAPDVEGATPQ